MTSQKNLDVHLASKNAVVCVNRGMGHLHLKGVKLDVIAGVGECDDKAKCEASIPSTLELVRDLLGIFVHSANARPPCLH